jgi:undecaprenyl-diphosphatase
MARTEAANDPASPHSRWLAVIPVSLGLSILSLLLFAWNAQEMLASGLQRFDTALRSQIHLHATPPLTAIMRDVTNLGDWPVMLYGTIALLLFFWYRGAFDYIRVVLVTMTGAGILDGVLKLAFHRLRPEPFFAVKPDTYSFPSGHALVSLCFYSLLAGMISLRLEKSWSRVAVWAAAVLLIGIIGFSRIYLGVHWPSDVLAGYAAAIMWMGAVRQLAKRLEQRYARKQLQ